MNTPFAVFAVVEVEPGRYAGTTRPHDDNAIVALPGGKVDPGETPEEALLRECREEGWEVWGEPKLIHQQDVEGRPVAWYRLEGARELEDYKERHRGIKPVLLSLDEVRASGYGNDNVPL